MGILIVVCFFSFHAATYDPNNQDVFVFSFAQMTFLQCFWGQRLSLCHFRTDLIDFPVKQNQVCLMLSESIVVLLCENEKQKLKNSGEGLPPGLELSCVCRVALEIV